MGNLIRKVVFAASLVLTIIGLTGCPNPKKLKTVESNVVPTVDMGINIDVNQYEGDDTLILGVYPFQTDGTGLTAQVRMSDSDTFKVSVVDQDVEQLASGSNPANSFKYAQSSLRLPVTFRIELFRSGLQNNATDTYVTLDALFETVSPTEGAIISRDGAAEFAWTLRDGDGNNVAGADIINGVSLSVVDLDNPNASRTANTLVEFDSSTTGPDGNSRMMLVPALSLVPAEVLGDGTGPWQLDVNVSSVNEIGYIPMTAEIDPAFANARVIDLRCQGFSKESSSYYSLG